MTAEHTTPDLPGDTRPDELLAASDRIAQHRARATRALGRGRLRRRILPGVVAASAIVVTLGAADRFVQGTIPTRTSVSPPPVSGGATSATARALAAVSRTLAADQRAIASLAQAQLKMARAGQSTGGGAPSAGSSGISVPSLGASVPLPTFTAPAVVAAPTVAATTGASVVVP